MKKKATKRVVRGSPDPARNSAQSASAIKNVSGGPQDLLAERLAQAYKAGKWMVAIWRVDDGICHLDRTSMNFPKEDLDLAMRLVVEDAQRLKGE